jgi:RNA polymerase sigma factor (sigma-70 family)
MKNRISVRKKRKGEGTSPYWNWVVNHQSDTEGINEHPLWEPITANPDQLEESCSLWHEEDSHKEQRFNQNQKLKRTLSSVLSKLTDSDRELVTLMSQEFYTIRELAEKLGVSKGFIQSRLEKIRQLSVQNLKRGI